MKRSLIALLLTLALVVTMSVFAVSAAGETGTADYNLTISNGTATAACPCAVHKGATATFTDISTLVIVPFIGTDGGHYYLSSDCVATIRGADGTAANPYDLVIHLNGHTINRHWAIGPAAYAQVTVLDNYVDTNQDGAADGYLGGVISTAASGNHPIQPQANKSNGVINWYGGKITAGPSVRNVSIVRNLTFNMYGGTIVPSAATAKTDVVNGGAVHVNSGTFNMHGGEISGVTVTGLGGAVYMDGGSFNMDGGTITGCSAQRGGAIYATGTGAKIVVDGGTITGCTATDRGGSIAILGGTPLEVKSGTIENGCCWGSEMGGNIYAEGNVTISGGTITGGNTTDTANTPSTTGALASILGGGRGGNICIRGAYTLKMTNGTVSNGVSPYGGNISIEGTKADHALSGGTISGGQAIRGGNIFLGQNSPSVTLSGVNIQNGVTYYKKTSSTTEGVTTYTYYGNGANIYNTNATLLTISGGTISGGTISGVNENVATFGGGSIYTTKPINITGGTITGGSAQNSFGGNLLITGGTTVTLKTGATITNGKTLRSATGGLNGQGGNVCILNGTLDIQGGTISNTTGAANAQHGGNIYLPQAASILKMSSGTITGGNAKSYGGNIYAYTNSTVNITGGTISNGTGAQGANIYVRATKKVTLSGAIVTGGKGAGASIRVNGTDSGVTLTNTTVSNSVTRGIYNAGALTISGTTSITGNTGATGVGIYNVAGATVTMNAGSISGNTATTASTTAAQGGNVYNAGTFIMKSGTIQNGIAQNTLKTDAAADRVVLAQGGNIYNAGTFTMTTGTITGGKAQRSGTGTNYCDGGNVYNTKTFTMEDGTISNGVCQQAGANVYTVGTAAENLGVFTMKKGKITGGNSANNFGAVAIADYGKFVMEAGEISGNQSTYSGGTIGAKSSAATIPCYLDINGGAITGGKATNSYAGNILISNGAVATIDNATISGGTAKTHSGNIAIEAAATSAAFNKCNILNGTAQGGAGGNVNNAETNVTFTECVFQGGTATTTGGSIHNAGEELKLEDCEISNGAATTSGGNIHTTKNMRIIDCTLTGGTAGTGGSINTTGALYISGGSVTGGHSTGIGGNINITESASTIENCVISDGVAGTKVVDEETGDPAAPTTDGRGGNVALNANTTFTNCVIRNGQSWGTANPGGGNIYYWGGDNQIMEDCTVTGGQAWGAGGNIVLHGTPTVEITGESYIQGGTSYHNWGGNIGYTNAAKLRLMGDTIVDGTDSFCRTGYHYGNNIGMSAANANVTHELYVGENAEVKNGDHAGLNEEDNRFSVAVCPATEGKTPKITISDHGRVDKIYLRGDSALGLDGIVNILEGYTGKVYVYTGYQTYNDVITPGATVYDAIEINGYTGTGSVMVLSHNQTSYPTYVDNGVLKVAGVSGFKLVDPDDDPTTDNSYEVESGFTSLDDVVTAGYSYAKLYAPGTYTLTAKTNKFPIDLNNQVVTFNTGSYEMAPIDHRTDGGVAANYTQLTVDNDDNVLPLTRNPISGCRYLNIKVTDEETGDEYWTSNRVRVQITKVTIKTHRDGIYYTTRITANEIAAPYLVDYGTAVSLVEMPGDNFLDVTEEKGILYTAFDLNTNEAINITTRSALIPDILVEGATDPDNEERASMPIYANSFVTAVVDGEEIKIMAQVGYDRSLKDAMGMLDSKVAELNTLRPEGYDTTIATAVAFYEKWPDPFANWDLPNLKKLAQAAA